MKTDIFSFNINTIIIVNKNEHFFFLIKKSVCIWAQHAVYVTNHRDDVSDSISTVNDCTGQSPFSNLPRGPGRC